ncbi:GNAT family N-acetyltransferase [Streptomyces decoyicus]|uniref:GNAT family N-acetyltransferase n=1 Tax=Streptomyces decoyicus TaxID=249567 RepID=UPI0004AB515C|nr:GNAT family N-acetyltransferase [Streptomyces decoyicus]KOG48915.1 acetyltransferase [Streptomyces decoyicus]QZY15999.1 GNAT family N-acetyltransferase [Streptomyces decoyicus]
MAPQLIAPTVAVHASFLAAMDEFRADGAESAPHSTLAHELTTWHSRWPTAEGFAEYVELVGGVMSNTRVDGVVPMTTRWWVDGDTYLGRCTFRHHLTPSLLNWGGHLGYGVRPGARRRGHATAILRAALPIAHHELGIDPVLVTCDDTNTGSRKVIEACGGIFEDQREEKLRYWIPAATAAGQQPHRPV